MGILFLVGFVLLVGVSKFLIKTTLEDQDPYQLNFLIVMGGFLVVVPFMLIAHRSLGVPRAGLVPATLVGVLLTVGNILFAFALERLPVGPATAISISYVAIAVVLGIIFLGEQVSLLRIFGFIAVLSGATALAWSSG